jgi:hypothetical protein
MTCGICSKCKQMEHEGPVIDSGYGYSECMSCKKIVDRWAPL